MKRLTLLLAMCMILTISMAEAQMKKKMTIEAGPISMKCLGDNASTRSLISQLENSKWQMGAGLRNNSLGFTANLNISIGEDDLFAVPIGVNIIGFRSIQYDGFLGGTTRFRYENSLTQLKAGLLYKPFKFVGGKVRVYLGMDLMMTMVGQGTEELTVDFYNRELSDSVATTDSKVGATRFGGALKLGFEADMIGRWGLNTYVSYGAMNILGRNDERGELLTPRSELYSDKPGEDDVLFVKETKENVVSALYVTLSISYRL
jgi:hypothetical protein